MSRTLNTSEWLNLETQTISPECRDHRGQNGAWDEAVRRLREVYLGQTNYAPGVHLALSISRGPIEDIDAGEPLLPHAQASTPQGGEAHAAGVPENDQGGAQ